MSGAARGFSGTASRAGAFLDNQFTTHQPQLASGLTHNPPGGPPRALAD
jgi:hypothetical protein